MFSSYITSKTLDFFNSFFIKNNHKTMIIDPFSCVLRLAILSFKPIGTKISIINNRIAYNEPHFLQGPIRWTYGDNREDLHNLYSPIIKVFYWYDCEKEEIKNILQLTILGLDKLKSSYSNNNSICHSINYYKQIIQDNMKSKDLNTTDTDDNNKIYADLKKLWNSNEISIVNNILTEMKTTNKEELSSLVTALESILYIKEKRVKAIITEHTTTLN